jgi:hypothetical protein
MAFWEGRHTFVETGKERNGVDGHQNKLKGLMVIVYGEVLWLDGTYS